MDISKGVVKTFPAVESRITEKRKAPPALQEGERIDINLNNKTTRFHVETADSRQKDILKGL